MNVSLWEIFLQKTERFFKNQKSINKEIKFRKFMFLFSPENFGCRHLSMDLKIKICKTVSLPRSNVLFITFKVNGLA